MLISLAAGEAATAAAATPPPVGLAGQRGQVELPFKGCFQRSKAALTSWGFRLAFAKVFPFPGGYPESVAIGPADGPIPKRR